MIVGYVKQENIPVKLIDRIKYYLGFFKIEKIGQSYVIQIPLRQKDLLYINEYEKEQEGDKKESRKNRKIRKRLKSIIERLIIYIKRYQINNLVFSNILSTQDSHLKHNCFESWCREVLKSNGYIKDENNIYDRNIHILNGKKVMQYMQYKIIEYILKIQSKKISQEDIYFLIKKDTKLDVEFLQEFIENAKTVNIVTNDIERFKKIQENLYEKEDILIGVSNNKNKALKRAKYIFNVNMSQNDLNKFKMNRDAILIYLKEEIKYCKNGFSGINVNSIKLKIPDEYLEEFEKISQEYMTEYKLIKLYESILLQSIWRIKQSSFISSESSIYQMNYKNANDIIQKDEIQIVGLIGSSGEISNEEILKNGN